MKATEVLMQEHRAIERMLNVLEFATNNLAAGAPVPCHVFAQALNFISVFADKCHHGKEEDTLFPVLATHDVPTAGGPIGAMLDDHTQGRAYVRAMRESLSNYADAAARKKL